MKLRQANTRRRGTIAMLVPAMTSGAITVWGMIGMTPPHDASVWILLLLLVPAVIAFGVNLNAPIASDWRKAKQLALSVLVMVPLVSVAMVEFQIATEVITAEHGEVQLARGLGYPIFLALVLAVTGTVVLASRLGALLSGRRP